VEPFTVKKFVEVAKKSHPNLKVVLKDEEAQSTDMFFTFDERIQESNYFHN